MQLMQVFPEEITVFFAQVVHLTPKQQKQHGAKMM